MARYGYARVSSTDQDSSCNQRDDASATPTHTRQLPNHRWVVISSFKKNRAKNVPTTKIRAEAGITMLRSTYDSRIRNAANRTEDKPTPPKKLELRKIRPIVS